MSLAIDAPRARTRVGAGFVFLYALALVGLWMALLTPPIMTLALRVAALDAAHKEANLSLIMGLGAVVAMLANPIVGLLSDRTTSRHGMRRPWLIGGVVVGVFGLYLVAVGNIPTLVLGWCIAQLGFNALLATLVALLPDQVPLEQRGTVSGVMGMCLPVGALTGIVVVQASGASTLGMFMWPGLVALVMVGLLTMVLKDRRLEPSLVQPLEFSGFFKSFWVSPRKAPDFAWAFVSRFMLFIGLATLLTYQVYFLIDRLNYTPEQIPGAMIASTLTSTVPLVLGSAASGWLSDRLRLRKPFVWMSALIYACGLAVIGMSGDFSHFLIGTAIAGFGQGVYLSVDLALVTEVLPNKETDAAKDLGIFNLANALPQSIAPALAPLFLSIGRVTGGHNYTALFIAAAVFAGLGALAIVPVKRVT